MTARLEGSKPVRAYSEDGSGGGKTQIPWIPRGDAPASQTNAKLIDEFNAEQDKIVPRRARRTRTKINLPWKKSGVDDQQTALPEPNATDKLKRLC